MMAQRRVEPWSEPVWNHALPVLVSLFSGKCAYCESKAEDSFGVIDHFRPRSGAMDLSKRVDPDHYYWLACEWTNLYLVCRTCNVNKKTQFPVDGPRAALGGSVADECAYCESRYAGTQPMDVEHFRPKGKVLEDDGTEVRGYYWLASEWANLLPSCIDCNRERRQWLADLGAVRSVGKGERFPLVKGSRRAPAPATAPAAHRDDREPHDDHRQTRNTRHGPHTRRRPHHS
jgi:5-methylcytosine-specific restriction endonuclease McrA